MFPKRSTSGWRSVPPSGFRKDFFFKGVGELRRANGCSGKIMERSGEIKRGNERNGLLCTKTCRTAPNWVLGEEKINNQPWCIHLKWTDGLSTLSGSSRASCLMNQCFYLRRWHRFSGGQGCSVSSHGKGRQPGSHRNKGQVRAPCRGLPRG